MTAPTGVVERGPGLMSSRLVLVAGESGGIDIEQVWPWFVGRYGWLLDDRRALPEPIPCRGAQGLWRIPPDVASRLA